MKILIGQVQGTEIRRTNLDHVTSLLVSRVLSGLTSQPIAALLQVTPDSHWISTRGDSDFPSLVTDLGFSRLNVPTTELVKFPRHLTIQALQGMRGAIQLSDLDHLAVFDMFDQAFFLVRMMSATQAWMGRLQDSGFDEQLQALGLEQGKLNVDSLDQDDYLTGTIAG